MDTLRELQLAAAVALATGWSADEVVRQADALAAAHDSTRLRALEALREASGGRTVGTDT